MDLSVVILNWNTVDDLRRCLASLHASDRGAPVGSTEGVSTIEDGLEIELIVVDNNSSDGSVTMVRDEYPSVRLVINARNLGFSAGNNRGIEPATGRFVMLLNPDTVVHDGAIDRLVCFADSHADGGIFGAKLLNSDGSLQFSCRKFPTLSTGFFRDTPLGRLFPGNRFNRDYLLTDWDHADSRKVDWVSGAAMMIRRECLEAVGLLDESFFMYCEDVDLCYRAGKLGWSTWYCADAVITHHIARASDQNVAAMLIERHRSMYRFFRKHYAATSPVWVWPLVIAGLSGRAAALVVKNRIDRYRQARQTRRDTAALDPK